MVTGLLLCITIIGIPLGLGNLTMIGFTRVPFGKDIVRTGDAPSGALSY